ncbi:MAG TPA: helix-turn-helix domain-containing protein [Thermoplasmata archaeon]|nr:helix-turn-helix domain-containing protein [Thermoplasmata archaeon]
MAPGGRGSDPADGTRARPGAPGARRAHEGCPIGELFALLGRPHTLGIIHAFDSSGGHPLRFGELESTLHLPPKTLAHRLRVLVEAGFLVRHAYNEIPPRVEYEPTGKIRELGPVFRAMDDWARRNNLTAVPVVSTTGRIRA